MIIAMEKLNRLQNIQATMLKKFVVGKKWVGHGFPGNTGRNEDSAHDDRNADDYLENADDALVLLLLTMIRITVMMFG